MNLLVKKPAIFPREIGNYCNFYSKNFCKYIDPSKIEILLPELAFQMHIKAEKTPADGEHGLSSANRFYANVTDATV